MKWYGVKAYQPSYDGHYIVRSVDENNFVDISYILWDGKKWCDFYNENKLFYATVTHFVIPDPIEVEG
jgi:hypothetical protein